MYLLIYLWIYLFISDVQIWYLTTSSQASEEKIQSIWAEFSHAILQTQIKASAT